MKTLKLYGVALLRVLAPFIVLMAIAVIMNTNSWKYLTEYFLVSNFFLFFPYIFLKYRNDKLKKMKYVDEIDDRRGEERRGEETIVKKMKMKLNIVVVVIVEKKKIGWRLLRIEIMLFVKAVLTT